MKNRDGPFFDHKENSIAPNDQLSDRNIQLFVLWGRRTTKRHRCKPIFDGLAYLPDPSYRIFDSQAREPHSKDELISVSASGWRITLYFFISLRLECYA